jgi:hypothetical protein
VVEKDNDKEDFEDEDQSPQFKGSKLSTLACGMKDLINSKLQELTEKLNNEQLPTND